MVNKAAVAVLGVIVLVSMGVGILIGMQLGAPNGGQASDGGGGGPTPIPEQGGTPTPVPTAGPGNSSPTPQSQQDDRSEQQGTTVDVHRFDADAIESKMEQRINEKRRAHGHPELDTTGLLAKRVKHMAENHSRAMVDEGKAIHKADGVSVAQRYRDAGIYGSCQFQPNDGGAAISPSREFENIAKVYAGKPYVIINGVAQVRYSESSDNTYYHENDTAVANAIVDRWFNNRFLDDRLLYDNASSLGVGVEIADSGAVYATADVC
ncbi:MAG: CAP domain-containing protein [Halorientalis sp.]